MADLVTAVTKWLVSRRAELAIRVQQHGLPLALMAQVPVATFVDGGMKTDTELRSHSFFSAPGWAMDPMAYSAITKPFIDSAGESLAKLLVAAFGDNIKYFVHLGPIVVQRELEHPELISKISATQGDPTDLASQVLGWDPIFYALMILRQTLFEYLSSIATLGQDDIQHAHKLAAEAVEFAGAEEVTHVARVPLAGIDVSGPDLNVEDLTVRDLSGDELGYLFQRRHSMGFQLSRIGADLPGSFSPEMWLQERVVLELRTRQPKTAVFYSLGPSCQKMLLALHLIGVEFAGAGFGAMLQEPRWMGSTTGQSAWPLLMPKGPTQSIVTISEGDLRNAASLATSIPDGAVTNPTNSMELSLHRTAIAMSRPEPREAIVDYTVALEALFLGGTEQAEARRRFALNGAAFAASTRAEKKRLYQELSNIYAARSTMVHGVDPAIKKTKKVMADLATIRDQACAISRVSLRKALANGWPNENTFLDLLLPDSIEPTTTN